jgi:Rieske Fe-S protein
MDHDPAPRRSFLAWATVGLGAIFSAILGAPVIAYVTDPRNRKGPGGDFREINGVDLGALEKDKPVQGVLRAVRRDGWTLHPSDAVGRVWIVLKKDAIPADFTGTDATLLNVFTTICPHLGCSVNLSPSGFLCPCHSAQFGTDGERKNPHSNPAARGMDSLEWQIVTEPPNSGQRVLQVRYLNYKSSVADKVVV